MTKPYNRSDMLRMARLDHDALNAEAEPFLDSGDLAEFGNERHWYQIVGTDYQIYAEEDADPEREGMYLWSVLRPVDNDPSCNGEIVDDGYDLGELIRKYKVMKQPASPAPAPPAQNFLPDGTPWMHDAP